MLRLVARTGTLPHPLARCSSVRLQRPWRRAISSNSILLSSSEKKPIEDAATETTGADTPSKDMARSMSAEELIKQVQSKPSAEVGIRAKQQQQQQRQAAEGAHGGGAGGVSSSRSLFQKLRDAEDGHQQSHGHADELDKQNEAPVSDQWRFLFDETELEGSSDKSNTRSTEDKGDNKELLDQIPGSSSMFPSLAEYSDASSPFTKSSTTTSRGHQHQHQQQSGEQWKDPKMNNAEKDAFKALFASLFETKPKEDASSSSQKEPLSIFSAFKRPAASSEGGKEESWSRSALSSSTTSSSSAPAKKEDPMDLLDRHLKTLSDRTGPIYVRGPQKPKPFVEASLQTSLVGDDVWAEQAATVSPEGRDDSMFLQIREENMAAIKVRNELNGYEHDVAGLSTFVSDLLQAFSGNSPVGTTPLTDGTTDQQQQQQQQPLHHSQKLPKVSGMVMDELLARAITIASSSDVQAKRTPTLILTGSTSSFLDQQSQQHRTKSLQPLMAGAFIEHARRQGLSTFIQAVRSESYKALIRTRWENFRDTAGCLAILQEMRQNGALIDPELQSMIRRMKSDVITQAKATAGYGWDAQDHIVHVDAMLDLVQEGREQDDWNGDRTRSMNQGTEDMPDAWRRPLNRHGGRADGDDRRSSRPRGGGEYGTDDHQARSGRRGGDGRRRAGGDGNHRFGQGESPFPQFIKTMRY